MMFDLNKEREAFEAWIDSEFSEDDWYCEAASLKRIHNFQEETQSYYCGTENDMWMAWFEAKAQAVPEDWVIVPQELPLDMALKIAKERIIEQPPLKDPILNEILEKAHKENLQYEQCRLISDYKEMVKRLSELGAEG
ncbi:hypothetical protein NRA53_11775 [Acinetobacter baumannii]|nr:hypothetical protein [Acinetobacter baumannii]MDC5422530.1 hypothetical protein [Acinetobacter baumannii]